MLDVKTGEGGPNPSACLDYNSFFASKELWMGVLGSSGRARGGPGTIMENKFANIMELRAILNLKLLVYDGMVKFCILFLLVLVPFGREILDVKADW